MPDLLQKYNKPVPRYTSYPPANFFTGEYTDGDYLRDVEESNTKQPGNISIYIHIPFCYKLCFYCGCNSLPYKLDRIEDYTEALLCEIKLVSGLWDKSRKISQIHYGGGTPNAIHFRYLQKINDYFSSKFDFIDNPEIAIECNPAHLDAEYIKGLQQAGFNRYSIGIQDFNLQVLKASNREPSALPVGELVTMLRADNRATVNFDFIYGLPHQTAGSFASTIKQAIEYKPDRLVTFSYAHVPWVNANQQKLEKIGLPSSDEKMKMYNVVSSLLTQQGGYKAIGLDHFVQPDDELYLALQQRQLHRNFQGYCTRRTTGQVYAFGVSGISQLADSYGQNTKDIETYISALKDNKSAVIKGYKLNDGEMLIRTVVTQLMCNNSVTWEGIAIQHNKSADEIRSFFAFAQSDLEQMQADGLLQYSPDSIEVKDKGKAFIRNIAAAFDPLLKNTDRRFSKTV